MPEESHNRENFVNNASFRSAQEDETKHVIVSESETIQSEVNQNQLQGNKYVPTSKSKISVLPQGVDIRSISSPQRGGEFACGRRELSPDSSEFPRPLWERVRVRGSKSTNPPQSSLKKGGSDSRHTEEQHLQSGAMHVANSNNSRKVAFTLAEILITLGIIGVVAALTLPTLIQNYQKHVTVTKLQKAYSILGQVAQKSFEDNGDSGFVIGEEIEATAVEKYFNTHWLPYFKGVSISPDHESIMLANGKSQYKYKNGELEGISIYTYYKNGRIFFTTSDGMCYFIIFCAWVSDKPTYRESFVVYIDVNGTKQPNTFGKDVFKFSLDSKSGVVRPIVVGHSDEDISENCEKYGEYCSTRIMRDGWQIKYKW